VTGSLVKLSPIPALATSVETTDSLSVFSRKPRKALQIGHFFAPNPAESGGANPSIEG